MTAQVTSTDLDQWSDRIDARAELPGLVRRLIMASARPEAIRFPAHEGTALHGLDGVVQVSGGAAPFVPKGRSVWEVGTDKNPRSKATKDYGKRTAQTTATERARATFVFVTSRRWGTAGDWVRDMKARADGWKDIVVLDGEDLATWLETRLGVHAFLSGHLGRPTGLQDLGTWLDRWSVLTEPSTPAEILLAGRRSDVVSLLEELAGPPRVIERSAGSVDEVVAFVAASLLLGPGPSRSGENQSGGDIDARDNNVSPDGHPKLEVSDDEANDDLIPTPETLEALRSRCVIVEDQAAWMTWSQHEHPQILVPLFYPDSVQQAVDAGHHVLLPRHSQATDTSRLRPLNVDEAREAWIRAGIDFRHASDYAVGARRNLRSVRRRIARHPRHRLPDWAEGPSQSLLAPLLLAGAWEAGCEGDEEVVLALTERATWRALARDLTALTNNDDPPLRRVESQWSFTDVVDAWDVLSQHIAAEDLVVFIEQVSKVLTEPDPLMRLTGKERIAHSLDNTHPRRRYSGTLREGLATTLALLGSASMDRLLDGHRTPKDFAASAVRQLLSGADANRWILISRRLPLLAEAAPEVFLESVEASLRDPSPAVMELFTTSDDGFGQEVSHHAPLLWALENLAFSSQHVSRVASILARLADADPGGRLGNRPIASLTAVLHLRTPQGAICTSNRFDVLDSMRRDVPEVAAKVLARLVTKVNSGMMLNQGPRFRDWRIPREQTSYAGIVTAIDGITDRLLEDAIDGRDDAWLRLAELVGQMTPAGRVRVIEALETHWPTWSPEEGAAIAGVLTETADKHRRYPDARWSMSADDLQLLHRLLTKHGPARPVRSTLFSWRPVEADTSSEEGRAELERLRTAAVQDAFTAEGIDGVRKMARDAANPLWVGLALAAVNPDLDDALLDLLNRDDQVDLSMAQGYAMARAQNDNWLAETVERRADVAVELLLIFEATVELLAHVANLPDEQAAEFWSRVRTHHVNERAVDQFIEGLLGADRPYSAIDALGMTLHRDLKLSVGVVLAAVRAPLAGTAEDLTVISSASYVVGALLDQLEALGASNDDLAPLEFFYHPLLEDERSPRAVQQALATDPSFFADVVSKVYRPDDPAAAEDRDVNESPAKATDTEEPIEAEGLGEEPGERVTEAAPDEVAAEADAERSSRLFGICWDILHHWSEPLPGTLRGTAPDPDQVHTWVLQARDQLAALKRTGISSAVIGAALASRQTEEDGTWPCVAVREVLEREQDQVLEDNLAIARTNQRGVTVRGVHDGGTQERKLAAEYSAWANAVRDRWPRSGKLLDRIAESYLDDARREDASAERYGR